MRTLLTLLLLWPASLFAAPPKVVATIPPLAAMVMEVMEGVTTPITLLPANAEPHSFSLRPSQIAALLEADIVFAVGLDMEPWLERVEGNFRTIQLGEAISEALLPARNFDLSARVESDPHLWLDPGETILWVLAISQNLIEIDPDNTSTYRTNEFALLTKLVMAKEKLDDIGARLKAEDIRLVVSHDAYQYLERRLGMENVGMLSDFSDRRAGARSLSAISRLEGRICLIGSPEDRISMDLLVNAPRISIDPIGAEYVGEPDFVARYYEGMVTALESCFDQP